MVTTACTNCKGAWPHALAPGPGAPPVCGPCYIELTLLSVIPPGARVLDVGAGIGRYARALYEHTKGNLVMLDAHLETLTARKIPQDIPLLVGDLRVLLPLLRDHAFDAVIAIDLIEHLDKDDGRAAAHHMLRIAKRNIVLFTPDGYMPQDTDVYGLGNEYQRHRSGWTQSELLALAPGTCARIAPFHETGESALLAVLNAP